MKHTPGPWVSNPAEHCTLIYDAGADRLLARIHGDDKTDQANAVLIKAAPDMAETLQSILHHAHWGRVKDGNELEDIYQLAAAALAKAVQS